MIISLKKIDLPTSKYTLATIMYLKILLLLLSSIIVRSKKQMEGFVVGGLKAKIIYYPHSVLLNIACRVSFICGGSVLNQHIVLTAAHCLEDCEKKAHEVVVIKSGHENMQQMGGILMKDFIMHKYYSEDTMANDICLVSTQIPLKLGSTVKRVALMRKPPKDIKLTFMAGWGVMNTKMEASEVLLSTKQQLQPPGVCKLLGKLPRGTFCAGPITGKGAPDQGDSGSALIAKDCIQLGLVSYKVEQYSLVVYTNVSYHYNWIQGIAMKLFCHKNDTKS